MNSKEYQKIKISLHRMKYGYEKDRDFCFRNVNDLDIKEFPIWNVLNEKSIKIMLQTIFKLRWLKWNTEYSGLTKLKTNKILYQVTEDYDFRIKEIRLKKDQDIYISQITNRYLILDRTGDFEENEDWYFSINDIYFTENESKKEIINRLKKQISEYEVQIVKNRELIVELEKEII